MDLKRKAPPAADNRDLKRANTTSFVTEKKATNVRSNYWPLELLTNQTIFKYHFEFVDGKIIDDPTQVGRVISAAFKRMGFKDKISRFIWGNSLFTLVPLPQQFIKASIQASDPECTLVISGPDTFNFDADVKGMQRVFRSSGPQEYEMTSRKEGSFICQIINILMKPILIKGMGLTPMGRRGFYNVNAGEGNDRHVSFMPGFNPVVVLQNNRLFLHTDFQYRAIARDNALRYVQSTDPEKLAGQSVFCEHNKRHYIISGLNLKMTPRSTFTLKDGSQVSFADYYQSRYGLRVRNMDQHLLEVTQRRKQGVETIYLIPEFCKMAGIHKDELKNTRLPTTSTTDRHRNLSKFITDFAASATRSKFTTVKLQSNFFNPEASILRPQKVKFHVQEFRPEEKQRSWDHLLRNNSNNKMLDVPKFQWKIYVTDKQVESDARAFYDTFVKLMRPLCPNGLEQPQWIIDDYRNISQIGKVNPKPAVVLVVLPVADVSIYNAIKRDLLLAGVPGQIVVREKFLKGGHPDMSKVTKAGLQLLAKAGAVLWSTTFEMGDPLGNKLAALHTCVFGIERSIHRKTGTTTKMAVTCTVDKEPTRFSEYFNYHVGENANSMPSLQSIIERGLAAFRTKNNKLPGRLVFYSSGASEGSLVAVTTNDVREVNSAIAELYKGQPQPEVLYVLVCRGGTTRLFEEENGAVSNVKPGTVVDKHICDGKREFYLVSHDAGQKSVLPPKYILAYHGPEEKKGASTFDMKDLQRFSYALCHLYYNWPGPISCPAPLKYADKLAKLAAAAGLPSRPDNTLAMKLFYI